MHQIAPKLWVGRQADFETLDGPYGTEWTVIHAARDPWHRALLGYTGRGAPKEHPEYLFAVRSNRFFMNLVDAADPAYIPKELVDEAMRFIHGAVISTPETSPEQILICCNQGGSRAPTLGMLWMAPELPADFEKAEEVYRKLCPSYEPARGMREFARQNWSYYGQSKWADGEAPAALDRATQIWQTFCDTMKTDPSAARDQLIQSIVSALSAAEPAGHATNGRQGPSPD